jgi:hypothetical protein
MLYNNLLQLVWGQRQRWGKEIGVTKDCKGVIVLEKYKNAHHSNSHGVLWEIHDKCN